MKADYILQAHILDIIFEKKNKNYGAYPLRKFYHQRVYRSLGIILTLTFLLGLFSYYHKNGTGGNIICIPDTGGATLFEMPQELPKPPAPAKHTHTHSSAVASNADHVPVVTEHVTPADLIHDEGAHVNHPVEAGNELFIGNDSGATAERKSIPNPAGVTEPEKKPDRSIPVPAEVLPSYPGGLEALRKFLKKNLVTPGEIAPDEQVSVTIQFIVGYDGSLKGFEVTEDGGAVFNDEVIRVLKKMPEWIPGKAHGENVSVYYSLPVIFTVRE